MTEEPTNTERAERIRQALETYCHTLEGRGFQGDEDDVKDMLADIMHFCDEEAIDFEGNLQTARMNYEAEKEE